MRLLPVGSGVVVSLVSLAAGALAAGALVGCQWLVDDADREVYRLVETRQRAAIGEARDAGIDQEQSPIATGDSAYAFVPHPTDWTVPEAFNRPAATQPATDTRPAGPATTAEVTTRPATQPADRRVFTLADGLQYAFHHARDFQSAKEDLYLAALRLTLERHLWTPRFVGEIESQYANYGQVRDFDHAMAAVATVGVEQRLPYGGEVTAQVVNTLMRDLTHHVTTSETGQTIIEANIPLLRGAGPAAYESRFQAERNLIYAVRTFERFRRQLAVRIAGSYFDLQQFRQRILNARESVEAFMRDVARAEALWRTGRIIQLDVLRAEENRLRAVNTEVEAVERYETALDAFKIELGMTTETEIDVELPTDIDGQLAEGREILYADSLEQALCMPDVTLEEATSTALKHRLDLLNVFDRIDDSRRGVKVAENNILPELNARGNVRLDTDPEHLSSKSYNTERTTWRGFLTLELPLDRKAERNALRESMVDLRRAERAYDQGQDQVRLEVRRAVRQVAQQRESLEILRRSRDQARLRRRAAQIRFELGTLGNRDVVEAQNELLNAQDRLAQAQADYRLAILEFRLSTDTLRIGDDGRWAGPVVSATEAR